MEVHLLAMSTKKKIITLKVEEVPLKEKKKKEMYGHYSHYYQSLQENDYSVGLN